MAFTPTGLELLGFSNRYPGAFAERMQLTAAMCLPVPNGLDARTAAQVRPGIVHAEVTLNGDTGPWAGRIGFDQTAGSLAGVMMLEGADGVPGLPAVPVVNDYITAWFLQLGILRALMLRAESGGSYRVQVSLTRVALWLLGLGVFDKLCHGGVKPVGNQYQPLTLARVGHGDHRVARIGPNLRGQHLGGGHRDHFPADLGEPLYPAEDGDPVVVSHLYHVTGVVPAVLRRL